MRVSKADGSRTADPQRDALVEAAVDDKRLYEDRAPGRRDDRHGPAECLKSPREGDTLIVRKVGWLGRDSHHLVNTVHDLTARGIGLKLLTGQGAAIDTTAAAGKLVLGTFAALAEFERELTSGRTIAGLASARARVRTEGRPFTMTPAKVRLATASMGKPDTKVNELFKELGITRQTLHQHASPNGEAHPDGARVLARRQGCRSDPQPRGAGPGDHRLGGVKRCSGGGRYARHSAVAERPLRA
jgi:DNA invertase Pin-like site-specific DNA recombinase